MSAAQPARTSAERQRADIATRTRSLLGSWLLELAHRCADELLELGELDAVAVRVPVAEVVPERRVDAEVAEARHVGLAVGVPEGHPAATVMGDTQRAVLV